MTEPAKCNCGHTYGTHSKLRANDYYCLMGGCPCTNYAAAAAPSTPAPQPKCDCGVGDEGYLARHASTCALAKHAAESVTAARPQAGAREWPDLEALWTQHRNECTCYDDWTANGSDETTREQMLCSFAKLALLTEDYREWYDEQWQRAEKAAAALAQREAEIARLNTRCAEVLTEHMEQLRVALGLPDDRMWFGTGLLEVAKQRTARVSVLSEALRDQRETISKLVLPRLRDAVAHLHDPKWCGIVPKEDLEWLPIAQCHLEAIVAADVALAAAPPPPPAKENATTPSKP